MAAGGQGATRWRHAAARISIVRPGGFVVLVDVAQIFSAQDVDVLDAHAIAA